MVSLDGWIYLAFKGAGTSEIFVTASRDGITWTGEVAVGANTDSMPAIATFNDLLYVAWKTPDQGLWLSWSRPGGSWVTAEHVITDGGSSLGPSLASTSTGLVMGWKGLNTDRRIFYSRYENGEWSPQQVIPGTSTNRGPSVISATPGASGLRAIWTTGLATNYEVLTSYQESRTKAWTVNASLSVPGGDVMRSPEGPTVIPTGDNRVAAVWKDIASEVINFWNDIPVVTG
jgi:hypothetical protein